MYDRSQSLQLTEEPIAAPIAWFGRGTQGSRARQADAQRAYLPRLGCKSSRLPPPWKEPGAASIEQVRWKQVLPNAAAIIGWLAVLLAHMIRPARGTLRSAPWAVPRHDQERDPR